MLDEAPPSAPLASLLKTARQGALLFRSEDLGTLRVAGPDRLSWLNGLLSCDLKKLAPGQALPGFCLSKTGKIQADVLVLALPGELLIALPRRQLESVREELDHHLIMEDAELGDASEAFAWTFTVGPLSSQLAARARDLGLPTAPFDRTGLGGCVVAVPHSRREELERAWSAETGVELGPAEAWEALRCETFVPRFGVDFDERNNPHEASLERVAVSFEKGCYLGQEAVCMLEMRGQARRRLVQVSLPEEAQAGDALTLEDGSEVGAVTSVSPLAREGKRLGIASVKRVQAQLGVELHAGGGLARVTAILPGTGRPDAS